MEGSHYTHTHTHTHRHTHTHTHQPWHSILVCVVSVCWQCCNQRGQTANGRVTSWLPYSLANLGAVAGEDSQSMESANPLRPPYVFYKGEYMEIKWMLECVCVCVFVCVCVMFIFNHVPFYFFSSFFPPLSSVGIWFLLKPFFFLRSV